MTQAEIVRFFLMAFWLLINLMCVTLGWMWWKDPFSLTSPTWPLGVIVSGIASMLWWSFLVYDITTTR